MSANGIDVMIDRLVRQLAELHGERLDANENNFSFIVKRDEHSAAMLEAADAMERAAERMESAARKTGAKKKRRFFR